MRMRIKIYMFIVLCTVSSFLLILGYGARDQDSYGGFWRGFYHGLIIPVTVFFSHYSFVRLSERTNETAYIIGLVCGGYLALSYIASLIRDVIRRVNE